MSWPTLETFQRHESTPNSHRFSCTNHDDDNRISQTDNRLRHALMTWGEKFTAQECDVILREAPVDSRGRIDIKRFANLVTRGQDEEEEA